MTLQGPVDRIGLSDFAKCKDIFLRFAHYQFIF